jgi:DNA-binding winged helix-turn-helix (wHTH) protein
MREDFVSGLWTVLADPLEIYFAGKLLTLQKRLARLLRELIREGVVSHRTAFHISTHGPFSSPANVRQNVYKLRRALEAAGVPWAIETITGHALRLVEVEAAA